MTMTLAHPASEDLGRFVEGTLDDAARAAVVEHIADCDECRVVVVDSSEFIEPARAGHSWWVAIAASVLLVAAVGTFTYSKLHDPLAKLTEEYAQLKSRPIEGRLSVLPYVPLIRNRGSNDEVDLPLNIMQGEAASLVELSGNDAKTLHARGIGLLLDGNDKAADDSLPLLMAAAAKEPSNARYQSDLAAALIAAAKSRDTAKLQLAVEASGRALQIDPHSREALFNRALALEFLDRKQEAIAAYTRYLALDPSSNWANEVRQHQDNLRSSLSPS
jgi:tetratricopeptide (TPR) repeat protein